jgi:hypothetical protein
MANESNKNEVEKQSEQTTATQVQTADDDWELPGQACTLRPGMPGFEECEACQ